MANTIANLTNINFLTKTQYDGIASPADNELYAVDAATDGSIISQLGLIWKYQPDNFGGGCLSIPYGNLSDKFKIQVASVTTNANNFTWTFPVAFDYFCLVVSNADILLNNKTLSSVVVTNNNYGSTDKHTVVDLIAIGI